MLIVATNGLLFELINTINNEVVINYTPINSRLSLYFYKSLIRTLINPYKKDNNDGRNLVFGE